MKKNIRAILTGIVRRSKLIFPMILILAAAGTVSLALKAGEDDLPEESSETAEESASETATAEPEVPVPVAELQENTDPELERLITAYYEAYANGDVEAIRGISNYMDELEALRIPEMSNYVESYPELKIYTKPGPLENSYLVYVYFRMKVYDFDETACGTKSFYVCTDENGQLYLNEGEISEAELQYISEAMLQDDVVELYNEVNVEYNNIILNNTDLFYYIQEMVNEVQTATGRTLADQITENDDPQITEEEGGGAGETQAGEGQAEGNEPAVPVSAEPAGPIMATATTTVNVRSSDSERADRLGKVARGEQVEVLEQRVNGWSQINYQGQIGYIKSEYLQLAESVNGVEVIGQVTAATNVNVRQSPSETAERLGILAGGEVVDLLERTDGWCKINYNGQVGYVKEDFVE